MRTLAITDSKLRSEGVRYNELTDSVFDVFRVFLTFQGQAVQLNIKGFKVVQKLFSTSATVIYWDTLIHIIFGSKKVLT